MRSQHHEWVSPSTLDPEETADLLLRDLHSTPEGLSETEAKRRLLQFGPNELQRRRGREWPQALVRQLTHPLALLLWVAAGLLLVVGSHVVAAAVVLIIMLNAAFSFVQEVQAERAVEALAKYLPQRAKVVRNGAIVEIDATQLVPGDIVVIEEGDRIAADTRLLTGAIEVDMSALTGESVPTLRSAALLDVNVPLMSAHELVFSGTSCTGGQARGVAFATGMATEIGRIAALSERVKSDPSPLERQVRRAAWLIAAVSVMLSLSFIPVATLAAHLTVVNSLVFAAGLLAGMVPEGLLPVITLALAVAVRELANRGALVKRLSAVETLGSTDVICTDKTGTLTQNRMTPVAVWTAAGRIELDTHERQVDTRSSPTLESLGLIAASCNNARIDDENGPVGDPTEVAVLSAARSLGAVSDVAVREAHRRWQFHFDPEVKLMSTIDRLDAGPPVVHTKGAPEALLPRCSHILDSDGKPQPLDELQRSRIEDAVNSFAAEGLRVLGFAQRQLPAKQRVPHRRGTAEQDLCLTGLIAMLDPPRPGIVDAVAQCHTAGIRIIVITGDHPLTAAAIAERIGITGPHPTVVTAEQFEQLDENQLAALIRDQPEVIFARASPEAKLHIAEALRGEGHVVAMTGDGVNDAPALRRADIGVAMGLSGTDVAREAATMVLTDDDFGSIVTAVHAGRRIYDNVRKFIVYIFAHAVPEVVPFLLFALSGGAIPLPLTILQLLAFDVGSETLPALSLSREPAEPGIMQRPPRPRNEGVIRMPMLLRAWLFLGVVVTGLSLGGYFYVLLKAGWHPGVPVDVGTPMYHVYRQATTMTFLGMITGQIGTAFAVRTQRASLRSVGIFSNKYLLAGIAAEIVLAAILVYGPPLQTLLGTEALPAPDLLVLLPFPFVVWGADELRRYLLRRSRNRQHRKRELAHDARGQVTPV
ncbi:cation-translocating P-type ATPase [Mycobacterium noviomagense]|uniref:Magnesium-transporting ATPase n=1 Tax=Mycobacterium noviomagense TaxID=459858 RepID=A0A7I7PHZ8_9MYCO|nr:cation-transporting P-type ATPase [Mycobacterium noviomagense]ORB11213.1 magnesium-transporting ATPase [Mycobacterium noviomagense]BBY08243.1 magnesium-transporting ATPase [Mycobacterium noviomagense]